MQQEHIYLEFCPVHQDSEAETWPFTLPRRSDAICFRSGQNPGFLSTPQQLPHHQHELYQCHFHLDQQHLPSQVATDAVQETRCVLETGGLLALVAHMLTCPQHHPTLHSVCSQVPSDLMADDQPPRKGSGSPSTPGWPLHHHGGGMAEGYTKDQNKQQRPSLEVLVSKPGSGFGPGSSLTPAIRMGVLRAVLPNIAVTAIFIYEQNVSYMYTHTHYHRPRDHKGPQGWSILVHKVFYLIVKHIASLSPCKCSMQ